MMMSSPDVIVVEVPGPQGAQGESTAEADEYAAEALGYKNAAAASAGTATTQAGIATTKAAEAEASAASIAGGPVASINGLTGAVVLDPADVPSVDPTLDLRFTNINGAPFIGNLTRATIGGYRQNSKGVYVPTVANEPNIDFSAGVPIGTGFYGAYTNLLLRSEEFDNASWTKSNVTVTANSTVGPDGATTMDTLDATPAGGSVIQTASMTPSSTAAHTLSVVLKQGSAAVTQLFMAFFSGGTTNYAIAQITWATKAVALAGVATGKAYVLDDLGNGEYRLSLTGANSGGANTAIQFGILPADASTGTVIAGMVSLTTTAFPVPYVPTTSAAVVRNADSMVISGTDFTDFFNPVEGALYLEGSIPGESTAGGNFIISIDDTTSNNFIQIRQTSVINGMDIAITSGGIAQADTSSANIRQGSSFKVAFSFAENSLIFVSGGATIATDASLVMPVSPSRLRILGIAGLRLKRMIYFPKALDATTLQRMTA